MIPMKTVVCVVKRDNDDLFTLRYGSKQEMIVDDVSVEKLKNVCPLDEY